MFSPGSGGEEAEDHEGCNGEGCRGDEDEKPESQLCYLDRIMTQYVHW